MNCESFKSRLQRLDPIFLSNAEQGALRVLEKTARAVCEVALNDSAYEEQVISEVESFLSNSCDSNSSRQSSIKLSIHLVHEAVGLEGTAHALAALVKFLETNVSARIIIRSNQSVFDYMPILSLAKSLREDFKLGKEVGIQLSAPFGEYREVEMETLFNLGVRLKYASGWIQDCPTDQIPAINVGVLRSLSEFGFRVPVEWYVHENNIQGFETTIQNLLIANFSAGFSLPLVSKNPYHRFESGFPNLPDALAYCQLLMRTYKQYPYYDDVFYPLNILALLVKEGGWIPRLNIPAAINFILDEKGHIGIFRQSPALNRHWSSISEIAATPLDGLRNRFLQCASEVWKWENVPYCRECCWRHICGGLDPNSNGALSRDKLDTMCGYRKLFLEHFANLRASDYVVGVSEKEMTSHKQSAARPA
jgi:hypothetical protein